MESQPHEGLRLDPREEGPLEKLLACLARIFSTAPLYPPGHTRYDADAAIFLGEVKRILDGAPSFVLYVAKDAFLVQSEVVELRFAEIKRLYEFLEPLAIVCVEIDDVATGDDLHALAMRVVQSKQKLSLATGLQHLDVEAIPDTIRIHEREFGQRTGAIQIESLKSVERTVEGLRDLYSSDEVAREGDQILRKLFSGVAERVDVGAHRYGRGEGKLERSIDEILEGCAAAIRDSMRDVAASGGGITDTAKLFECAEAAVALADDVKGVGLMLELVKDSEGAAGSSGPGTEVVEDDSRYELSLEELEAQLLELAELGVPIHEADTDDPAEYLSILLQILFAYPSAGVLHGMGTCFARCFSRPIGEAEHDVLVAALVSLFESGDEALVDRSFPIIANAIGRDSSISVCDLLVEAARRSAVPGVREMIWPHAVDELLLGGETKSQTMRRKLSGLLENSFTEKGARRVTRLRAMHHGAFSSHVFSPPMPELFPLFADLLEDNPPKELGKRLLRGLQESPPRWVGAEAIHVHGSPVRACRAFLAQLMREGAMETASPELRNMAAGILCNGLADLAPKRREEDWVVPGILALAALPERKTTKPLLERIKRERKHLFKPVWPASCRKAAAEALKTLKDAKRAA